MAETDQQNDDAYSDAETDARREAILKRVLATPPKLHKAMTKRRVESQSK